MIERRVLDDPAAAAADRLAAAIGAGGHIALTGGSTPRAAYELLAAMDIDWTRCTLWFGDDRCVPPDDALSNYGMVRAALLDRLSGDLPEVRRIEGELGPHAGADAYEQALAGEVTHFDLVLLGLGPDAHCASLFPHDPALAERDRRAVGIEKPGMEPLVPRVTLTLPVINAARQVLFLVTGEEKADAVARAFAAPPDPGAPASLVAPEHGTLTVLLDAAAAAQLPAEAQR
jgi:6-phosphogluconolactonase